ncbi:rhamnosyltransferase WsaF family glycosyltransferase [Grimontia marina]|uniref:WsaF C-terminal domain-containing protein n=1 Tax=Grimontia marina TaxID=646534 RepID=A0A128ESZ5_9GAMM|nr:hypothetical protein [Grimontia marina]CZF77320.1 hypothetical protein GMA8713_00117 [Grimontia marina]
MLSRSDIHKIAEILIPSRKIKVFGYYQFTESELKDNFVLIDSNIGCSDIRNVIWFLPQIANINAGGIVTILKLAQYLSVRLEIDNIFVFEKNINKQQIDAVNSMYPGIKYEVVQSGNPKTLPSACVGICTFWTTAFSLLKYNKCKRKYYLLQDDERSFYAKGSHYSLVESTYTFGFTGISNSFSIQKIYQEISGKDCFVYRPGIDESLLSLREIERPSGKTNVLVYCRPSHQRNCFEAIIVSLKNVASFLGDDYIFHLVGETISKNKYDLNKQFIVHGNISDKMKIRELYSSCSFGISFITSPTYSYHQLDIISSGICLISNHNEELKKSFDEGCLYFVGASPSEIEISLPNILTDRSSAEDKIVNSYNVISQYSWELCGKAISNILRNKSYAKDYS